MKIVKISRILNSKNSKKILQELMERMYSKIRETRKYFRRDEKKKKN